MFVDRSRRSIRIINNNIDTAGFRSASKVVNCDAASFLAGNTEKFDIAFLDPPYSTGLLQSVLPAASANMTKSGLII